jgi:catechol 2,3-dioxygenase-like lactoylglutathione lyase family enzyme
VRERNNDLPPSTPPALLAIDHVQLAMPVGGEHAARRFYCETLGMTEVAKPVVLAVRGGCWFEAAGVRLHLGAEHDFRPARKAHPALVVRGLRAFVERAGLEVRWSDEIPGSLRCHLDDVFGNRLELIDG